MEAQRHNSAHVHAHTHTVFFPVTILLFLYFTQAACYVSLLSVLVKVWKDGCVPDFNGQTNVFQSVYKFTHSLNRANILFPYTREEVLSKESRFCFFSLNRPRQKSSTIYFCRLYFTTS